MKPKLEGKPDKERREMMDRAMNEAIEADGDFKAWNVEWERVASHWECHYWGSAATYCRMGSAMGSAMKDLLAKGGAK